MSGKNRFALWQSMIIIAGLLLTGISSVMLYQSEVRDVNNALKIDVDQRSEALARMLSSSVEPLHSISALFVNGEAPSYAQFDKHAKRILSHHNTIQAIEWIPKVTLAQRGGFETKMQELFPDFEFKERGPNNNMLRAKERSEYFPVYYVSPVMGNEKAIGFDLASNAIRKTSLIESRDTAREVATAGLNLVQEKGSSKGFLVFLPIYKLTEAGQPSSKVELKDDLLGFVLGAYRITELFNRSALTKRPLGLELMLYDNLEGGSVDLLLHHTSRTRMSIERSISYRKKLPPFYSRQWSVLAMPTHEYVDRYRTYIPYAIAIVGTLLTLITVFYLRVLHNQSVRVQKLVDDKTRELSIVNQKLKRISRIDALTEISNRRSMDRFMEKEWSRAIRHQSHISAIMIDIDNFKKYNDFYGHQMGDDCLKKVAYALSKVVGRPGDMVARYGGEEFALIIAHTEDVSSIARKCQTSVERLNIVHEASGSYDVVTVSAGYCTVAPKQGQLAVDLFKAADRALYLAKKNGKNRVEKALFECSKHAAVAVNDLSDKLV